MLQGINVNFPIGMSIKIQLFLKICQGMAEFFRLTSSENWETNYKYEKVMTAALQMIQNSLAVHEKL